MKGSLLKDDHRILAQQTANVQGARRNHFKNLKEIVKLSPLLRSYMQQAIAVEQAGMKVPLKKTAEFKMPEEFAAKLKVTLELKEAFHALTSGRQLGYLLHFAGAKQVNTREARIEMDIERILAGKGLDD